MFDRATLQLLATKLDTNAITLKEAKRFVLANYGLRVAGATRTQFIRNAAKCVPAAL